MQIVTNCQVAARSVQGVCSIVTLGNSSSWPLLAVS